ncbi:sensor histidine kinase [Cognatiluteimonas telluris]|jgi:two-component system sensor histidine kinase KdpD|uniref:sensor histidine kinase n=1 Tax=Cognatiluteimonas telluris TaxID=1104775 RepID=UPI00140C455C|nr:ATP-binding protein [Lysobacter telluris]
MPFRAANASLGPPAAGYLLALAMALLAVLAAAAAEHWLGLADLSLVFMLAVLLVAARTRTGPAVVTALLCFLAYNFFFIEPRYTLYISASHGVATVLLFLAAALLAGRMASQLAMKVQTLHAAHGNAQALQELSQRLAVAADEADVATAARDVFRRHLRADAWVRLDQHPEGSSGGSDTNAWRQQQGSASEHGWLFLPLRTPDQDVGVIGLKLPEHLEGLDELQHSLVHAMADNMAQAILRTRLVRDLQTERVAGETERLRSALLSSVSHDLRTPLAAIIGAADSLDNYGDRMDGADRRALLDMVRSEGERLDRYIQNLLDMTRLGQGALALERDWIGIDELIGSAIGRLRRYQPGTAFPVSLDPAIGPIHVHPALVEQALFNVIENAAKFSPADAAVAIHVRGDGERLRIDVTDRGPGIPESERQRIFDMFYSVERGDRGHNGTGLGLAICRGVVLAHGGEVEALPGPDGRGTTLRILLPMDRHLPTAVP